jgi:hypothetical protein
MSSVLRIGDLIHVYGRCFEIKKVNKKTVVVDHPIFGVGKYNYNEVHLDDGGVPMDYGKQITLISQYFVNNVER